MGNNIIDSKLDETVKQSLGSYEANYDAGDWSRMERMLDSAPKSITKKGSYNIALIIGAAVLVGGFLIYKGINSSKTLPEATTEEIAVPETKTETAKSVPAPANVKIVPPETPMVKSDPVASPEVKSTISTQNNTVVANTEKSDKKTNKTENADSVLPKNQKVSVMGNEPVFGDMIDSSKGIIHETKEKESTKKAAKSKGTSGIGLSGLMNLNADSIKKQKEMMQKDTIK